MIRLLAFWAIGVALVILAVIVREERLARQGRVPLGRLRQVWLRSDRRGAPRYRLDWPVRYQRTGVPPPVVAETRDVSPIGACLVLRERFERGAVLSLDFTVPARSTPLAVTGRIVWTREIPPRQGSQRLDRLFLTGFQFYDVDHETASLLDAVLGTQGSPGLRPANVTSEAKRYARIKRRLFMVDLGVTGSILTGLLVSHAAQRLGAWVTSHVDGWPLQVAVYVGILGAAMTGIGFPLDWVRSFTMEHRFHLSNQRFSQWLWEYAKRLGLGAVLGLIVVEGLAFLLRRTPQSWWWWGTLFWLGWSTLLTRLAPTWLIPLFYRQRPLENAPLKQRLESLLARCGTKVRGVFEVNLSRTTRKANACLCGLGKTRRVLLSDTLLSAYPPEEVEVVLAHEAGHHRLRHLGILILVSALTMGMALFVVDRLSHEVMVPLGVATLSDLAALPLIGLGLFLVSLLLMPILNGISRWCEAQADRFALQMTENPQAFIAAMHRLAEQNLAEVEPPRWVEILLYDHPSIARRIAMARQSAQ